MVVVVVLLVGYWFVCDVELVLWWLDVGYVVVVVVGG